MAQWLFVDWLLWWVLETPDFEFEWDHGNSTKNHDKHGVQTDEIEAAFRSGRALPLGIQVSPTTVEHRLGVIAPAPTHELLMIVFTFRSDRIRVISARRANKKERQKYEEVLRQIT